MRQHVGAVGCLQRSESNGQREAKCLEASGSGSYLMQLVPGIAVSPCPLPILFILPLGAVDWPRPPSQNTSINCLIRNLEQLRWGVMGSRPDRPFARPIPGCERTLHIAILRRLI